MDVYLSCLSGSSSQPPPSLPAFPTPVVICFLSLLHTGSLPYSLSAALFPEPSGCQIHEWCGNYHSMLVLVEQPRSLPCPSSATLVDHRVKILVKNLKPQHASSEPPTDIRSPPTSQQLQCCSDITSRSSRGYIEVSRLLALPSSLSVVLLYLRL